MSVVMAVVGLHLDLERVDVLQEKGRLTVRPVVEQQIAPLRDAVEARDVEVAERIPLRVGDVAARAGVRAHARGREDRADRPVEVGARLRVLGRARRRQERDERSHRDDPGKKALHVRILSSLAPTNEAR
jgi:hypothetical protein